MANFADWCCQILAGHIFDRQPRPGCTLHDGIERGVHPYRCHVCGGCFVCQHSQTTVGSSTHWICRDGTRVPSTPSPGTPAE